MYERRIWSLMEVMILLLWDLRGRETILSGVLGESTRCVGNDLVVVTRTNGTIDLFVLIRVLWRQLRHLLLRKNTCRRVGGKFSGRYQGISGSRLFCNEEIFTLHLCVWDYKDICELGFFWVYIQSLWNSWTCCLSHGFRIVGDFYVFSRFQHVHDISCSRRFHTWNIETNPWECNWYYGSWRNASCGLWDEHVLVEFSFRCDVGNWCCDERSFRDMFESFVCWYVLLSLLSKRKTTHHRNVNRYKDRIRSWQQCNRDTISSDLTTEFLRTYSENRSATDTRHHRHQHNHHLKQQRKQTHTHWKSFLYRTDETYWKRNLPRKDFKSSRNRSRRPFKLDTFYEHDDLVQSLLKIMGTHRNLVTNQRSCLLILSLPNFSESMLVNEDLIW